MIFTSRQLQNHDDIMSIIIWNLYEDFYLLNQMRRKTIKICFDDLLPNVRRGCSTRRHRSKERKANVRLVTCAVIWKGNEIQALLRQDLGKIQHDDMRHNFSGYVLQPIYPIIPSLSSAPLQTAKNNKRRIMLITQYYCNRFYLNTN